MGDERRRMCEMGIYFTSQSTHHALSPPGRHLTGHFSQGHASVDQDNVTTRAFERSWLVRSIACLLVERSKRAKLCESSDITLHIQHPLTRYTALQIR